MLNLRFNRKSVSLGLSAALSFGCANLTVF